MFIEVTNRYTGNKTVLPRLSAYLTTVKEAGREEVIVGSLGGDLRICVKETYEEIRELLGLVRTSKEVTDGN